MKPTGSGNDLHLSLGDWLHFVDSGHKRCDAAVCNACDNALGAPTVVGPQKVDRPDEPHYAKLSPEPIDVIEGWELNYRIGNAVKYLARAGKKASTSAASDYRKAISYILRELNAIEGKKSWS